MKVLFLVDNIPVVEMFKPIMEKLPCQSVMAEVDFKAIKREKPDVVVVAREETTPLERKIVNCGIPTLLVPHGLPIPNEMQLWQNGERFLRISHLHKLWRQGYWSLRKRRIPPWQLARTGMFRLMHDFRDGHTLSKYNGYSKIAAYGEGMRDTLLSYHVPLENIVITGNPKYSKYLGMEHQRSGKVLVITDYLVEFGLWSEDQRVDWLRDVCDAVFALTGKKAEILIHPILEDKSGYEKLVKRYNLPANVHQMELTELIGECDVAVTLLSTSGLEMMVAGKPLVVYNPYNNPTMYQSSDGVNIADSKRRLDDIIKDLLYDGMGDLQEKLVVNYVYRQTYLQDGKSAERIADLIVEMVGGG